ncbi:MAG TPA: protease inhibitor I42 family protein [Beijerinckiaceae bacterium]|jgi:predicted secreted protein
MAEVVKGKPITARAGETISLTAPSAGVGGYLWHADVDSSVGHVVTQAQGPPGTMVGAGSDTKFEIKITGKTDGVIRLVLRRPWEEGAAKIVEHPVRVRK